MVHLHFGWLLTILHRPWLHCNGQAWVVFCGRQSNLPVSFPVISCKLSGHLHARPVKSLDDNKQTCRFSHGYVWHGLETERKKNIGWFFENKIPIEILVNCLFCMKLTLWVLPKWMQYEQIRCTLETFNQHFAFVLPEFIYLMNGLIGQCDVQWIFKHLDTFW